MSCISNKNFQSLKELIVAHLGHAPKDIEFEKKMKNLWAILALILTLTTVGCSSWRPEPAPRVYTVTTNGTSTAGGWGSPPPARLAAFSAPQIGRPIRVVATAVGPLVVVDFGDHYGLCYPNNTGMFVTITENNYGHFLRVTKAGEHETSIILISDLRLIRDKNRIDIAEIDPGLFAQWLAATPQKK